MIDNLHPVLQMVFVIAVVGVVLTAVEAWHVEGRAWRMARNVRDHARARLLAVRLSALTVSVVLVLVAAGLVVWAPLNATVVLMAWATVATTGISAVLVLWTRQGLARLDRVAANEQASRS